MRSKVIGLTLVAEGRKQSFGSRGANPPFSFRTKPLQSMIDLEIGSRSFQSFRILDIGG
jgi:hypothetical protein